MNRGGRTTRLRVFCVPRMRGDDSLRVQGRSLSCGRDHLLALVGALLNPLYTSRRPSDVARTLLVCVRKRCDGSRTRGSGARKPQEAARTPGEASRTRSTAVRTCPDGPPGKPGGFRGVRAASRRVRAERRCVRWAEASNETGQWVRLGGLLWNEGGSTRGGFAVNWHAGYDLISLFCLLRFAPRLRSARTLSLRSSGATVRSAALRVLPPFAFRQQILI